MAMPEGPKSMSLYRVCCAASRVGGASAANKIIAETHINVLDFMLHLVENWEPRGPDQPETAKEQGKAATAEREKTIPKMTCVKANRTLDAVSDGAVAATRMCGLP